LRTIVFYISGHGFGHASRDIEIINRLLASREDVRVIARTRAAKWLFDRTIHNAHRFDRQEVETDTGAVQIDALHVDEQATVQRARSFMHTFDARVDAEITFLRAHGAQLVVSDIPPLGIAAAHRAGLPAVGLGNFTWDWIYSGYEDATDVVESIADAYSAASLAVRLPMHGGFTSFSRVHDVPFVARRSCRDPHETKLALGLPTDRRLALVSFGGYGIDHIRQDALDALRGYAVIGSAARPLDEAAMYDAGFRYEDVVRAVDVVVTKPGYGIVSECIANDTALLYTSRGRFAEYDMFVREMPRYLRCRFISHEQLFSGAWQQHLDAVLAQQPPPAAPDVSGADVAAALLLDMI
jgi:UDP:flavonoid glycosyltransferase YjiC (YdhE family)